MRGNGFGLIADVVIGVIGGVGGGYLFQPVASEIGGGMAGRLIAAFGAAMLLLLVIHLLTRRRGGRRVSS